MSLQIVLGGPGSNKSEILYREMIADTLSHPEKKYILIVPEQFTMQTQRHLTELHPGGSIMQIEILGFVRLAHRVFEELAVRIPDIIDDAGKSMLLRKVLAEAEGELRLYGSKVGNQGFVSHMKSLISELYQYGIGEAELSGMIDICGKKPLLQAKLQDSAIILKAFQKAMADRFITSEEILDRFCRVAGASALVRDAEIVIDGFSGNPFTPVQMRTVGELLRWAKKVTVTGCVEASEANRGHFREQDLFYKGYSACLAVKSMARSAGIEILPDRIFGDAGERSLEIRFLEKHFYRYEKAVYPDMPQHIRVLSAKNPGEEAEFAADYIAEKIRQGYHYRDIAVITGDMERYRRDLSRLCRENQIPFFMDMKRSLFDNAFVETIRAALEVLEKDFSYESVFRYGKGGFCGLQEEEQYLLENYVLQTGIRGASFYAKEWDYCPSGWSREKQERVNAARTRLAEPLLHLRDGCRGRFAVKEGIAHLRSFMQELHMEEKLQGFLAQFEESGDQEKVREYSQVFDSVAELLDQAEHLLGDERTGVHEFAQILDAGLSEKKVGIIPPSVDQVLIGSLDRSRIGEIKILLFLGLNEGIVPKTMGTGGIFTEGDREFLLRAKIRLAPTAREQAFEDRFFVYYFLTKPSEELLLSYSRTENDGKAAAKSSVISRIMEQFPNLPVMEANPFGSQPTTRSRGIHHLAEELRQTRKKDAPLDRISEGMLCYLRDEDAEYAMKLLQGAVYRFDAGSIPRKEAQALFESVYKPSITGLEQFSGCAYRYFLDGGLELQERKEYRVEQTDIGTLFHDAIEHYGKTLQERQISWENVTEEQRHMLVREAVEAAARGKAGKVILSESSHSARNRYVLTRVERMTDRAVWALGEHIKHSGIKPAYYEYPVRRGRIDRVDTFDDGEHVYVKIIDYKSGNKVFRLEDMYYGLQLQLVLYMREAMDSIKKRNPEKQIVPVGFFYFHIKDPYRKMEDGKALKTEQEEQAKDALLAELRMSGYVNQSPGIIALLDDSLEDEQGNLSGKSRFLPVEFGKSGLYKSSNALSEQHMRELLLFADEKEQELRKKIWEGYIEAKPYKKGQFSQCAYCPYQSVCGFDARIKGAKYRYYPKKKPEEIIASIEMRLNGGNDGDVQDQEGS